MMRTIIFQNVNAPLDVFACKMEEKDIDFTLGSEVSINKMSYDTNLHKINYQNVYKVVTDLNESYEFVNTLTGELTNSEAILYKDEIITLTKNDYTIISHKFPWK